MTEYNIFEIIKQEKKNIFLVSPINVNKIFCKYYLTFMNNIYKNMEKIKGEQEDIKNIYECNFEENISKIGNMIFNIFWVIFLTSFNIHITIFFIERASLLFYEFISLSLKEKNYVIETYSYINDAIIFTYRKTIGDTTLENILKDTNDNLSSEYRNIYRNIQLSRDSSFLMSKIINHIIIKEDEDIVKYKKNNKYLINLIYNIYKTIDIDKYLFFKVNKILEENKLDKSLFIITILIGTIYDFTLLNFFDFNTSEEDKDNFLNFIDFTLNTFINSNVLDNISYNTTEITKKKIYCDFKENVLRYIN
jgi:hypothetical protein